MSTWYKSESNEKPLEYDNYSSQVYVYLRKNITYIPEIKQDEEVIKDAHYEYDECVIPKEVEELITRSNTHTSQITSLEDAICDLMIDTTEE